MKYGGEDVRPDPGLWSARLPVLGGEEVHLTVGGIQVGMGGLDREGRAVLARTYGPFLAEGGPDPPPMTVTFRRAPAERFLALRRGEEHRVESRGEGERFQLWSYDFAGWFDPVRGVGEYLACPSEEEMFRRGVENYLRFLYSHLSLRRGGFLLHAAGLVRGGQAHLFVGPEGSGKSTITEASSATCEVLSDDLVLVVKEGGRYLLAGVPFFGTFVSGRSSNQVHPLHRAWYLQRGRRASAATLSPGLQRAYLLAGVSFLGRSEACLRRALDATEAFLQAHPVALLQHPGTLEFWEAIRRWERPDRPEGG